MAKCNNTLDILFIREFFFSFGLLSIMIKKASNMILPERELALAQVAPGNPALRIITQWHECNAREAPNPVNYQAAGRKRGDYA